MCMFGAQWKKLTKIVFHGPFQAACLGTLCHQRRPAIGCARAGCGRWFHLELGFTGDARTAPASVYPRGLCFAWAAALRRWTLRGVPVPEARLPPPTQSRSSSPPPLPSSSRRTSSAQSRFAQSLHVMDAESCEESDTLSTSGRAKQSRKQRVTSRAAVPRHPCASPSSTPSSTSASLAAPLEPYTPPPLRLTRSHVTLSIQSHWSRSKSRAPALRLPQFVF